MIYRFRAGLRDPWSWHPFKPPGLREWIPKGTEQAYRDGRKVRRKSTATHGICLAGPLHEVRVRRVFKGRATPVTDVLPGIFTVPPWAGRYRWHEGLDAFIWIDANMTTSDHERIMFKRKAV